MAYAKTVGATHIGVSPHIGYASEDLSFLHRFPEVERLTLPHAERYDLSPLLSLRGLKELSVSESSAKLSVAAFPVLEVFSATWQSKLDLTGANKLRDLYLSKYRGGKDLSGLPDMPCLERLELNAGSLISFGGIGRFRALKHLETHNLRELSTVADLCTLRDSLEFVSIAYSPRLEDPEAMACLSSLRVLRLNHCRRLASLAFLDAMPRLSEFRFVGTVVEDGDLSPLLRLDSVGFADRRGYSHKWKDLQAINDAKAGRWPLDDELAQPDDLAIATREELQRLEAVARRALQSLLGTREGSASVDLFVAHHLTELPEEYWQRVLGSANPDPAALIAALELQPRWGDGDGVHFDFTLPGGETQYVLSVRFNEAGEVDSVSMES
jgi:hypothetical protein